MSTDLVRDLDRPNGWLLLVDGSEQSYVDTADPDHLEFEYVQMLSCLIRSTWPDDEPLTALHLGGGLCSVPRWLAAHHPGSSQLVAEHSAEIAGLAASLGPTPGVDVEVTTAEATLAAYPNDTADLVVCDVYDGPETVTSLFPLSSLRRMRDLLRVDGVLTINLSDAAPFDLGRVVAATLRLVFDSVVLLAEPPVLRGRRSGNLVLAATDRALRRRSLTRYAAQGPIRFRVVGDESLEKFIAGAMPATDIDGVPRSGETTGRAWD